MTESKNENDHFDLDHFDHNLIAWYVFLLKIINNVSKTQLLE